MDELQRFPRFDESTVEDDDSKLCELSTILVASIQEIKDQISQVEYIFCAKIFPKFQSRSKSLQKRLLDARKITNDEWKKRESSLLNQIEELHLEKQHAQEEVMRFKISLEETNKKLINKERSDSKSEHEKEQLFTVVETLKEQLSHKTDEVVEAKKLQEKLLQQIDIKDQNLLVEQSKRKSLVEEFNKFKDGYKHLKSQYNFLLSKIGDSKSNSPSPCLSMRSPQDSNQRNKEINNPTLRPIKMEIEDGRPPKKLMTNQDMQLTKSSHDNLKSEHTSTNIKFEPSAFLERSASSQDIQLLKSSHENIKPEHTSTDTKSEPSTILARSAPSWRDTRANEEKLGGADPHDDFLDTPMENIRNRNMGPQEEVQDDMNFNISDNETQEIINPHKQNNNISVTGSSANKGFKYIEPVRKKNERENLKGVECKQCKKFYDAVLDDNNASDGNRNTRCEHHDGVSRHRYRYAPPMTPEGFWNIGFESEI